MTNIRNVSLSLIDPPSWNSRLPKTGKVLKEEESKIANLASSLKSEGQLTPISVEDKGDGRFELIFGSRRLRAAKALGWTEIAADVHTGTSASDRIKRNIMENAQRENLTTFEMARSAAQLRELGIKNAEIGTDLSISPTHVSNLHAAYTALPAPVLADWEKGHPAATIGTLCEIARKGKDDGDKVRQWDEAVAESEAKLAAGQKPGARGKGKEKDAGSGAGFPVSQKRLTHVMLALSSKAGAPDLSDDLRKWGKALLDFVTQGRESPPAGVPKIEPKAAKAAKGPKDSD